MPLGISPFKTQTMQIKSFYTEQNWYVSLKTLKPWRDSNPGQSNQSLNLGHAFYLILSQIFWRKIIYFLRIDNNN
jgi:hypothetical protein